MGDLGRAYGGAEMKEAGTFFVIAMFFLVLFYGYIESEGGFKTSGQTVQTASSCGSTDYRCQARQDAIDNGIDQTLFERQINQESAWNPNAVSPMGAIGIAQIMPSTAAAWSVDAWNPTASLSAAAKAMAWYTNHYGSWQKALAAYNGGSSKLNYCIANYSDWLSCMPTETQRYVAAIGG